MQNLYLPTSQLFHQICQLSKNKQITDTERKALKKLVIVEHVGIYNLLELFNKGRITEPQLNQELISLSKDVDMKSDCYENNAHGDYEVNQAEMQKATEYIERNPQMPEELASPLGTQLWRRKMEQKRRDQQKK